MSKTFLNNIYLHIKLLILLSKAITDPQLAAIKKIRKMQRKKDTKKRKIELQKNPLKSFKKRKLSNNIDNDNDF